MKKGNPDFKSEKQLSAIQNIDNFFDLRKKNIDFYRDHSFLLSEATWVEDISEFDRNFIKSYTMKVTKDIFLTMLDILKITYSPQ